MKPRRLAAWFAGVLVAVVLLGVAVIGLHVQRRATRTREAFEAAATPGSIKEQLLARGCERAAVLPMVDYEQLGVTAFNAPREHALLAVCEFVDTAPHLDCDTFLAGLHAAGPFEVLVNTSDGMECVAYVEANERVTVVPLMRGGRKAEPARAVEALLSLFWRVLAYR